MKAPAADAVMTSTMTVDDADDETGYGTDADGDVMTRMIVGAAVGAQNAILGPPTIPIAVLHTVPFPERPTDRHGICNTELHRIFVRTCNLTHKSTFMELSRVI